LKFYLIFYYIIIVSNKFSSSSNFDFSQGKVRICDVGIIYTHITELYGEFKIFYRFQYLSEYIFFNHIFCSVITYHIYYIFIILSYYIFDYSVGIVVCNYMSFATLL